MKPLPLPLIPFVVLAVPALAWFAGSAVLLFLIAHPGIPALAAAALITANQAVHPHPIVARLRELS